MKKKIIFTIITCGLLLFCFLATTILETWNNYQYEKVITRTEPLVRKKEELRQKIITTKTDYKLKLRPVATEELIFWDLNEKLYTEAFPAMKKYEVLGMIALTDKVAWGKEGIITKVQLKEILKSGWSTCALYNDDSDLETWYDGLFKQFEDLEISMPNTVFVCELYNDKLTTKLQALGFENVVFTADYDTDILFVEPEESGWVVGAYQWNFSRIRQDLQGLISNGKNRVFTVSFQDGAVDAFNSTSFVNMLNFIKPYRDEGYLSVMDINSAAAYRREKIIENDDIEKQMQEDIDELEQQKEEIQNQLHEIYSQFSIKD